MLNSGNRATVTVSLANSLSFIIWLYCETFFSLSFGLYRLGVATADICIFMTWHLFCFTWHMTCIYFYDMVHAIDAVKQPFLPPTKNPSCHQLPIRRENWVTYLPHKGGGVPLSALTKDTTSELAGLSSTTPLKCRAPSRVTVIAIFFKSFGMTR